MIVEKKMVFYLTEGEIGLLQAGSIVSATWQGRKISIKLAMDFRLGIGHSAVNIDLSGEVIDCLIRGQEVGCDCESFELGGIIDGIIIVPDNRSEVERKKAIEKLAGRVR